MLLLTAVRLIGYNTSVVSRDLLKPLLGDWAECSESSDEPKTPEEPITPYFPPYLDYDEQWKKDFKKDFKLTQVERRSTFMLLTNANTMYLTLVGLTDLCFRNNKECEAGPDNYYHFFDIHEY